MAKESIVDLTWASLSAARLVRNWKVAIEMETLSDHRYIVVDLVIIPQEVLNRRRNLDRSRPRK